MCWAKEGRDSGTILLIHSLSSVTKKQKKNKQLLKSEKVCIKIHEDEGDEHSV